MNVVMFVVRGSSKISARKGCEAVQEGGLENMYMPCKVKDQ
jgi:hypothetical protein